MFFVENLGRGHIDGISVFKIVLLHLRYTETIFDSFESQHFESSIRAIPFQILQGGPAKKNMKGGSGKKNMKGGLAKKYKGGPAKKI